MQVAYSLKLPGETMKQSIHHQRGEMNLNLVGLIAAIVIAIAAFLYAHDSSQRIASQQALIDKLQATVTAQEEAINKAGADFSELQTALQSQDMRLQAAERDLNTIKEEAKKRAAAAKAPAKPAAKKPAAKEPAKKHSSSSTHHSDTQKSSTHKK
jgi:hypothetical protein